MNRHETYARRRKVKAKMERTRRALDNSRAERREIQIDALLDQIKDEIDRIHEIDTLMALSGVVGRGANKKHTARRQEAARELIGYLCLHHNLPEH